MRKNRKRLLLVLMGLIVSCSLLNTTDEQVRSEKRQYIVLKNPALSPFSNPIPIEVKDEYPKYTSKEDELFFIIFKAALAEIGLFEKDCIYAKITGTITVPLVGEDIVISLESLKKAFEGVPNIYRIFNDYKKLENIIKKRDEEFGIKKKIGS